MIGLNNVNNVKIVSPSIVLNINYVKYTKIQKQNIMTYFTKYLNSVRILMIIIRRPGFSKKCICKIGFKNLQHFNFTAIYYWTSEVKIISMFIFQM